MSDYSIARRTLLQSLKNAVIRTRAPFALLNNEIAEIVSFAYAASTWDREHRDAAYYRCEGAISILGVTNYDLEPRGKTVMFEVLIAARDILNAEMESEFVVLREKVKGLLPEIKKFQPEHA